MTADHRCKKGQRLHHCVRLACAVLGWLVVSLSAGAATCSVLTTGVAFGVYSTFAGAASDSTGTVTVTCDAVTSYTVAVSTGGAGNFDRAMASGANRLTYNVFTDGTRSVLWGDGSGATALLSFSGTTGATHTVYGRIPARQNVHVGSYADSLIVTVTF